MYRNPINCVIPDYVLLEIASRGNERERAAAHRTLALSSTMRTARSQAEALPAPCRPRQPPRSDLLTSTGSSVTPTAASSRTHRSCGGRARASPTTWR